MYYVLSSSYCTLNATESVNHLLYHIRTYGTIKTLSTLFFRKHHQNPGAQVSEQVTWYTLLSLQGKNITGGISFALICTKFLSPFI